MGVVYVSVVNNDVKHLLMVGVKSSECSSAWIRGRDENSVGFQQHQGGALLISLPSRMLQSSDMQWQHVVRHGAAAWRRVACWLTVVF